jgi:thioredoxin
MKGVVLCEEHRSTFFMEPQVFYEKLKQNPRPVVVDLWAPWCGPCKMVKPTLEKLAEEYKGRVDLWEINADENQDLLRQLKVYGIPTLISYHNGEELVRYVGAKPKSELTSLFDSLSNGNVPTSNGLSNWSRFIRLLAGSIVVGMGWVSHYSWFLMVIGGIVMFSAIYDRCPIWKAITTQFKKMTAN